MTRHFVEAAAAGFLLVLAGCISTPQADEGTPEPNEPSTGFEPFTVPKPDFDFSTVVDPDHGAAHSLPEFHTAGHGLDLVGHTGVEWVLPEGMRGSITQMDVWDGYVAAAGFEYGPAFVIVDVRDPSNPTPLSYAPSVGWGWSAQFSHDGNYVFYACQNIDPRATTPPTDDCQTAPSVSVWDVSDKSNPRFVDWVPTAAAHNLQTAFIGGYDYTFTNAVDIVKFDRATQKLEVVDVVPGTHDATVARHPVSGDWLLYTGTSELAIYNVNDPAHWETVFEAGQWTNGVGWHDQVPFPYLVDGRALLALSGESFFAATGVPDAVTIVDVTDPANPVRLGEWRPPFADALTPWVSYTFSVHEMAATPQGQLAVAWYHGGVWVIDVSTQDRQAEPVTVAAYQPHEPINVLPATFAQTPVPMVPFAWTAGWDERGYLIIPDMHTGVYVLEPSWGLLPLIDSGA